MPREREHGIYGEYDARAYSHLVPAGQPPPQPFSTSGSSKKTEKRKKSKHKSHKRSKEKGDKDRRRDRSSSQGNTSAVALIQGRTNIVGYEDVSSDSGSLSDVSNAPLGPSRIDSVRENKRDQSPASLLRSYVNERSHSNSPVIRESSPSYRTEKSASRKSKKRQRSPEQQKHSEPKVKAYANPPKAYAEPPRAYAELSKSAYRNHSPPSSKKRYRSRSPTSPVVRRRSRSRCVCTKHLHSLHSIPL